MLLHDLGTTQSVLLQKVFANVSHRLCRCCVLSAYAVSHSYTQYTVFHLSYF